MSRPDVLERLREVLLEEPSSAPPSPSFVCIAAFAETRAVCIATVRKWIALGMPHIRVGRVIRVRLPEADAWLDGGGARAEAERRARRSARRGRLQ